MDISNGKYSIEVDESKKVIYSSAEGLFSFELGEKFNNEFVQVARKCANKQYAVIVDGRMVKPSSAEAEMALGKCTMNYLSTEYNFKKVYVLKLASALAQHQIEKSFSQIPGAKEKLVFVKDREEALSMI